MLEISVIVNGMLEENCYIAQNAATAQNTDTEQNDAGSSGCVLVDPGDDPKRIIKAMQSMNVKPEAVLITHGHFDHIGAVSAILDTYRDLPVYACGGEKENFTRTNSMRAMAGRALSLDRITFLEDGATLDLVGTRWQMIRTPGHSVGSVCYYVEESHVLFSGDTLFLGSCGRTDLATGDMRAMVHSIQDVLMKLPDDTLALPGHGAKTTIGVERRSNFIMQM